MVFYRVKSYYFVRACYAPLPGHWKSHDSCFSAAVCLVQPRPQSPRSFQRMREKRGSLVSKVS